MPSNPTGPRPGRRWLRVTLLTVAGLLLGGLAYVYTVTIPGLRPVAAVASGYMARVACACHYIAGRTLESCMTDREPGMERVRVALDPASRRATASVPFVASASATHRPGQGCVLDRSAAP
jgi:hypothetical protein